jgi:hypothetical protein
MTGNPNHDEQGRFTSKEYRAALAQLTSAQEATESATSFEDIIKAEDALHAAEAKMDITEEGYVALQAEVKKNFQDNSAGFVLRHRLDKANVNRAGLLAAEEEDKEVFPNRANQNAVYAGRERLNSIDSQYNGENITVVDSYQKPAGYNDSYTNVMVYQNDGTYIGSFPKKSGTSRAGLASSAEEYLAARNWSKPSVAAATTQEETEKSLLHVAYLKPGQEAFYSFANNVTEARKMLKNSRGESKANELRYVHLNYKSFPDKGDLEVVGPKDGRPLVVHVASGFGTLKVLSGNVIIESNSKSGNVVEATGTANVIVIPGDGAKLTARAGDRSHVRAIPSKGSRNRLSVNSDSPYASVSVASNYYTDNSEASISL